MEKYTIKDAAKIMNVPTSTIRYYDKEGLLPFLDRLESGYRIFSDEDLAMLRTIDCLKKTGMPIKEIRQFVSWVQKVDSSLQARYDMFVERKKVVEQEIADLQETLDIVNFKCWYYHQALEAGSEKPIEAYLKNEMQNTEESAMRKSKLEADITDYIKQLNLER